MASPASPAAGSLWTRANALTGLRLLAAPAILVALCASHHRAALGLFVLAVVTDLLDGRVARRYGEASPLGGTLDHATDASFVVAGIAGVAFHGEAPAILPWLIAAAFLQYALDSRALAGRPLRASRLGRWNGVAYFVLLGIPVVRDGIGIGWPPAGWVLVLGWALVATTVVSMLDRLVALVSSGGSQRA